jgi:EmrB/QacA subfamily drug resistance transporter
MGRKKAFLIGLVGFASASLLGGFSVNQQMLFGARALQGIFGALLAPAALSLISITFTDSKERAKAFGVYGALSGVGAAIGLIAGGLLTQYLSWRWCLFVNTPMAIIALFLAIPNVHESKVEGHPHYDVPGALTATLGMVSIVFGVSQASTYAWGSLSAWPYIALGVALLFVFFQIEARVKSPLLPLRLLTDRVRAGSYLSQIFVGLGLFGMFLFLTFYFQDVHQYSAVKSGLLYLPFSVGVILGAGAASQILPKFGPRLIATVGSLMGALGLLLLSFLAPNSSYLTRVMPAMIIGSLGLGVTFVAVASTALFNVRPEDAGAASAVLNTAQQIGGSFGTAIQNTIYVTSASAFVAAALRPGLTRSSLIALHIAGAVHGYDLAFRFGALMVFLAAVSFYLFVNIDRHHLGQHDEVVAGL